MTDPKMLVAHGAGAVVLWAESGGDRVVVVLEPVEAERIAGRLALMARHARTLTAGEES